MRYKYLIIVTCISLLFAIVPFIYISFINNGVYPSVPVEITDDSLYYFTRAVDIAKGNLFIGNPYILEYKDSVSPNFFVADWLWAIPLVFGFPILQAIFINQVIWFFIFSILVYLFFRIFDIGKNISVVSTAICIFITYWYIARPVAMQVVFPFFIAFIILAYLYIRNPGRLRNKLYLGIFSGIALYVYTYLAQIMALFFILVFVVSFLSKFKPWRGIFISGIISLLFSIPFILYSLLQLRQDFYYETLVRLGLLNTHMIDSSGLKYFILSGLLFVAVYLIKDYLSQTEYNFLQLMSAVLGFAVLSNIFTGIDFELAVHIGRFIELWLIMVVAIITCKIYRNHSVLINKKFIAVAIPIVLSVFYIADYQVGVWNGINIMLLKNEDYKNILSWVDINIPKQSVILANDSISNYVPLITGNYIVFNHYVGFHIMSDEEVKDRYLASRVMQALNSSQIKSDLRKFAGVGNTIHRANLHNRISKLCNLAYISDCDPATTSYELIGEKYFSDMIKKHYLMSQDMVGLFKDYNISYIIVDKESDKWSIPKSFKLVFSDGRFDIFALNNSINFQTSFK